MSVLRFIPSFHPISEINPSPYWNPTITNAVISSFLMREIIFSDERPDKEHPLNSIVVIEFKQPGRDKYGTDENPVLQAAKVIKAIREGKYKHNGRRLPIANAEIPAMIFVVADMTPKLCQILVDFNATMTPDNQGFYGYHANHKVYYEVMGYTKMLSDAKKRNRIFFDKLNLVDNR